MYVISLQLANFKSFEYAKMEFSKGINILVGKNNSGKSSLIRCVYQIQHQNAVSISDVRKGAERAVLLTGLEQVSKRQYASFHTQGYPFYSSVVIRKVLNVSETKPQAPALFFTTESIGLINTAGNISPKVESGPALGARDFAGLKDHELNHAFIYPFLSRRKSNVGAFQLNPNESHIISEEYKFILSKVKRLTNSSHPKSGEFNEWCNKIIETKVGMLQTQAGEQIGFYITDGDPISLNQMGDGILHVVGLLAMLLSDDDKLYVIEEIENDLHPEALKYLLQFILTKTEHNQFIISTHSNIVLKYLGTAEHCKIFETEMTFREMPGNTGAKIPTSTVTQIPNTPADRLAILRKLGYDAFDFEIYDGYLIMEESSAERIVRDFLIPWFVPGLSGRLQTIAAGGVSKTGPWLEDLLRLFVYTNNSAVYRNKAWVITDGDPDGLSTTEGLRQKFSQVPHDHFDNFSLPFFESYYPFTFDAEKQDIETTTDKVMQRKKKRDLINKVVAWCYANGEEAKLAFETSAAEVIGKLKGIETQLNAMRQS